MTVNQLWQLKKQLESSRINLELQNLQLSLERQESALEQLRLQQQDAAQVNQIQNHTSLLMLSTNLDWLEQLEKKMARVDQVIKELLQGKNDKQRRLSLLEQVIDRSGQTIAAEYQLQRKNLLKQQDKKFQSWSTERAQRRLCD